jgi:large subunit ribosomal protein L11
MIKEIEGYIKLQIKGGGATPGQPVGPALGSKKLNIMEFCKQFNARTEDKRDQLVPVVITYYKDKTFDFVIKTPPATSMILEAASVNKGSSEPNRNKVGTITWEQIKKIAEVKFPDLNSLTMENAIKVIAGSARSIGINITGDLSETIEQNAKSK